MRKVKIFKKTWPQGYRATPIIEEIGEGKFHCWGSDYEENDSGPGNYTVAIVELPDGSIITPQPSEIKFIN